MDPQTASQAQAIQLIRGLHRMDTLKKRRREYHTLPYGPQEGRSISDADIARVSPLLFKHINFLGRYAFDLPQAIAGGALRPLRNPNSE